MSTGEDTVPDRPGSREVESRIFEAELVDEAAGRVRSWWRRFMNWWQRSPRVPAALKSRQGMKHAAMDAGAFMLRFP